MRNGIYRVWYKGSADGAGAALLIDGQFIACNRTHCYSGPYKAANGRFTADLHMSRHTGSHEMDASPDDCMLHLEGLATDETVAARATSPDGFALDVEYIWIGEA